MCNDALQNIAQNHLWRGGMLDHSVRRSVRFASHLCWRRCIISYGTTPCTYGAGGKEETIMTPNDTTQVKKEQFQLTGEALLAKIKELIHEGNVRRIIVKNENGHVIMEFPLTVGLVGAALAPVLAAVGAAAALLTKCSIEVEHVITPK
jgi:hypothetical protein